MPNEKRAERAARSELYLGRQRFLELNGQLRETYEKLDDTLAHSLRMTAAMVDTAQEIGLEPERGQKLFLKLAKFSNSVMSSRDELIESHLEATRIRMRTDQAVTDDGCYPNPFPTGGEEEEKLRVVA